jgi:UDP-2-acetamido-2-deoxy-ribo-hexuluronate aminotransferase
MSKLISRDMLPMVDLKGQYANLQNEILSGFQDVLEKTQFINGPAVKDFASHLSEYLSVKYTIPCGNGTDALQIALMSLGLRPGDEVITTPFTFVATAEVIGLLGLVPVFVDVDPETFLLDVTKLESKITPKTKCVIPVHLFGQSVISMICVLWRIMHKLLAPKLSLAMVLFAKLGLLGTLVRHHFSPQRI